MHFLKMVIQELFLYRFGAHEGKQCFSTPLAKGTTLQATRKHNRKKMVKPDPWAAILFSAALSAGGD